MNRGLLWGLGATTAVAAWALLNPAPSSNAGPSAVIAAAPARVPVDGASAVQPSPMSTRSGEVATTLAAAPLPAHWPQPNVEAAPRNPFLATPPPAPKPVVVAVKAPPSAPPPPPPVSDYRFWGRMNVSGGQRLTYVSRGEAGNPVAIDVGTRLEDGWSVDAIGDNAIVLVHAATQQRSTLSIPPHGPAGQQ